jgi:Leucine rich repeat
MTPHSEGMKVDWLTGHKFNNGSVNSFAIESHREEIDSRGKKLWGSFIWSLFNITLKRNRVMERRNTDDESDNDRKSLQSSGNTNRYTSRPSITSHSQILSDGPSILCNPLPIWAAPITMREDSFRDEDLINSSLHSFATNPVAVGLNHSKTITGTFRPSLEDMVDVNMSAHGKNFQTSFTNRASRSRNNRRRFSVFSVFSEDMEYDDVTATKSQLFDVTLSKLLYVLVSITLSLALLVALLIFNKNSNNGDIIPNSTPSVKQGYSGKFSPHNDCGIHSNFENNAFLQCECKGHIFLIAESVSVNYNELKESFLRNLFPSFRHKIQSCDSSNVALVWLAGDTYTNETEFFDRYMLALLYSAWKGYDWNHQELWLDSQKSHCEWYGVVCDSRQRTIDLFLGDNNLQGWIPPEIAAFYSLRTIDISGNYVEGRIPRELGDCHALQTLRLGGNKLTFSIPTELAFLTNLVSLELDHNHLAGTIPTEIMGLHLLNLIDLSGNNLFGTIPKEVIYLQNCSEYLFGISWTDNQFPNVLYFLRRIQSSVKSTYRDKSFELLWDESVTRF